MRRRMRQDILPKSYTKKSYTKNIGSPFNRWFKEHLKKTEMTLKEFALYISIPYSTLTGWRYKVDPQIYGQVKIARGLHKLGIGDYKCLLKQMDNLTRG